MSEGKEKKEAPRCRLSEGAYVHMAAVQERSLGCARDDGAWGADRFTRAASPPFLEDGILVSQPSPLGEGAPQGRIGHWRYEREREGVSQAGDL